MYADVIGAKAGYKYEATINGGNYIIELYGVRYRESGFPRLQYSKRG